MSTLYLDRPVFDWPLDWATSPAMALAYDLREEEIGFATPRYEQLQSVTRSQFTGTLWLDSEAELEAWRAFMALTQGRLVGFWIPAPMGYMEIEPDVASNVTFLIKEQGLLSYWEDYPCRYLVFSKPGQALQFGKILSVVKTVDGREQVTLDAALPVAVDETWDVGKLLYARFVTDEDRLTFQADNRATKNITAIELTEEYGEIEASVLDVYLYQFTRTILTLTEVWRMTGLNQAIVSQGDTFASMPIEHRQFIKSMKSNQDSLQLVSWHEPGNPLSEFVPFKSPANLRVEIFKTTFAAPDTRTLLFAGRVQDVAPVGKRLVASCGHRFWGQEFPRFFISPYCNHFVYDEWCGANPVLFTATGTIVANPLGAPISSSRMLRVAVSLTPVTGKIESQDLNYFALGWLETGVDANVELRGIRQSSVRDAEGIITVRMTEPLAHAIVGQVVKLIPGCDGSLKTCDKKFNRLRTFGGHSIPAENAATDPLMDQLAEQGKKG